MGSFTLSSSNGMGIVSLSSAWVCDCLDGVRRRVRRFALGLVMAPRRRIWGLVGENISVDFDESMGSDSDKDLYLLSITVKDDDLGPKSPQPRLCTRKG